MYLAALLIFFSLMLVFSFLVSKRIKGFASMTLADKQIPWYVNTGTLVATYVGSGALVGGAALAFTEGYNAIWFYAGGWVAILLLLLMATRIRRFGGTTTCEFIGGRFGPTARTLSAVVVILAETAIVGYNLKSTGWVLNLVTGMNLNLAVIMGAIFIIAFTVIAGFLSVAYTDYFQGIVIILSLVIGLPFALHAVGGWSSLKAALPVANLHPLKSFSLVYMLKTGLPTLALVFMGQSFWQRLFAAKSTKDVRKTSVWWLVGVVIITFVLITFAIIGSVMFPKATPESIIMVMAKGGVPTLIGVFMMMACAGILVTSADSFLLAVGTVFMNDLYIPLFKRQVDEKRKIALLRIAIVVTGVLAYILATFFSSILSMIYFAYTMEGGLIVVVLAAFFWKRASNAGAIASIIAVCVTTIVWEIFKPWGIATIFATLVVGALVLVAVSLLTPPSSPAVVARFASLSDKLSDEEL